MTIMKRIKMLRDKFGKIVEYIKKKKFFFIALAIILIAGGSYFIFKDDSTATSQYTYSTVTKGNIVNSITESGEILSTGNIDVTSTISGTVGDVYVNNGDTVAIGQKLFYVTSTATDEEVASAYSQYLTAVKNYNTAELGKKTLEGQIESAKQSVYDAQDAVDEKNEKVASGENNPKTNEPYTQNEQNSIDAALNSAKISLESKEMELENYDQSLAASSASLKSAKLAYDATQDGVVTSTGEGIIQNVSITTGDTVTASGSSQTSNSSSTGSTSTSSTSSTSSSSSSALMTIKTSSEVWLKTEISEVDIQKINTDQSATITLDAIADKEFHADVERIDTTGTNSSGVVTYNVYLKMTDATDEIRPGMTSTVSIETEKKEGVLMVPNAAIKSYKGGKAVQIQNSDGSVVYQVVEIGIEGDSFTEITSGLTEEQTILTSNTADNTTSATSSQSSTGTMGGGMMMGR